MNTTGAISNHDLFIGDFVLSYSLDKESGGFPPAADQVKALNSTIQGLSRAIKSVYFQSENDSSAEASFLIQPVEDIANAIMILSQLSEAVQSRLSEEARE